MYVLGTESLHFLYDSNNFFSAGSANKILYQTLLTKSVMVILGKDR